MPKHSLSRIIAGLPKETRVPVPETGPYAGLTQWFVPSAYQGLRELLALVCLLLSLFYFRHNLFSIGSMTVPGPTAVTVGYVIYFAMGLVRLHTRRVKGIVTLEDVVQSREGKGAGGWFGWLTSSSRYQWSRNMVFLILALGLPLATLVESERHVQVAWSVFIFGFLPCIWAYGILGVFKRGSLMVSIVAGMLVSFCACLALLWIQVLAGTVRLPF